MNFDGGNMGMGPGNFSDYMGGSGGGPGNSSNFMGGPAGGPGDFSKFMGGPAVGLGDFSKFMGGPEGGLGDFSKFMGGPAGGLGDFSKFMGGPAGGPGDFLNFMSNIPGFQEFLDFMSNIPRFQDFMGSMGNQGPGSGPAAGPANSNFYDSSGDPSGGPLDSPPVLMASIDSKGLDVDNLSLEEGPNGGLTEESKRKVNALIGRLTDEEGVEIVADVYRADDGTIKVRLTRGSSNSFSHDFISNTLYVAHTHPAGAGMEPSDGDYVGALAGVENVVVATDGTPGNETGSEYNRFV